jgi:hypothetical protein
MKIHIHQHETLKYIENVEWSNFGSFAKWVPFVFKGKTSNLKFLEKDKCNENLMLSISFQTQGVEGLVFLHTASTSYASKPISLHR